PYGVAARIAHVGDHLLEIGECRFSADGRQLADGLGVAIAPCLEDRREGLARHAQGIDDDVVERDPLELEPGKNAEDVASDEEIRMGRSAEARRDLMPEVARVERAALEVQHPVVLGDDVQVATLPSYSHELGHDALRIRDRMDDMAAHREIEARIGRLQLVHALMLERNTRRKPRIPLSSEIQMLIDDVDAEHAGARKKLRQPRRPFTGAAAGVENVRLLRKLVATEQRDLLRPDS